MSLSKVFFLSSEIEPFSSTYSLSNFSVLFGSEIKKDKNVDIRMCQPKYGYISERKYILREVIRLRDLEIDLKPKNRISNLKSALLYDTGNFLSGLSIRQSSTLAQLEYYDPFKGQIPAEADKNIDVKNSLDLAVYSNSTDINKTISATNNWSENYIGTTWWDLSKCKFIDYEQIDVNYAAKNWGAMISGSTVDIYEWTKSTKTPDEWSKLVDAETEIDGVKCTGEAFFTIDSVGANTHYHWTEDQLYDKINQTWKTYYYFWIKNKTTLPITSIVSTMLVPVLVKC